MFDFKKEVNRYKPITEVDEIEQSIHDNEVQDIMDLLKMAVEGKNNNENE